MNGIRSCKTISNNFNDNMIDIEKQYNTRHCTSISDDDDYMDYTEYMYNGSFSIYKTFMCGFIKLMCPGCCRKRAISSVSN